MKALLPGKSPIARVHHQIANLKRSAHRIAATLATEEHCAGVCLALEDLLPDKGWSSSAPENSEETP